MQEATASLAAAKSVSMGAATAAALLELDGIFTLKKTKELP